ncbi:hypothetical protein BJ742DRAFT_819227 [Cladochytrium replicatum]|nr:hypothetical protein BJ742DRAFT_819227 [Cladochytrium replicatum]
MVMNLAKLFGTCFGTRLLIAMLLGLTLAIYRSTTHPARANHLISAAMLAYSFILPLALAVRFLEQPEHQTRSQHPTTT